mgnify:CR=1 FL=1
MKNFTAKLWAILMLILVSVQAMATDTFTANRTDFRDESIYFMITTRFYDGDPGNNVLCWDFPERQIETKDPAWRGDFQGVIDKLDYIKALGFTAIWITPVVQNASGCDYHGYHAMDFTHVDTRYQDSKDPKKNGDVMFQELIDKAHAKGIKIILDIVLNHTGNFGEATLCKQFTRDQDIHNQADINACMIPDASKLGSDYESVAGAEQYGRRLSLMKNTRGENSDNHNYWHHVAANWNWDLPNRWWGQIAGDCVDLNTENDEVADYLVRCYGEFIKMGVDGFRIDTSGHISRLTFNHNFIPQFTALGEKYKDKRLNKAPFFMYGEVCARFGGVQYRGQDCLSPFFYTWKSPDDLMSQWDGSKTYWDSKKIMEGNGYDGHQMELCEKDETYSPESNNAFMINGAYHKPDYSQSSGFNVIDFPLHYNFNSAASAYGLAKDGDKRYNDATYNVVYVDSHDYGPQPNDLVRFGGSDAQWAENLSLMFTFRGIPCIYYGSEVGFRRGQKIDDYYSPLKNTGRAYFGGYITGDVEATDFGDYTATGNAAASLNHDLAQHLIRLNKIRQAVPALRKGQWTDEGCTANGGIAFKRAYEDSYALVALNGGATFTGCPAGTYTDVVTGQTYSGSTITVDAPKTQGQVRVLVKDWTGGKIGEDGPFIYTSAAQHKSGQAYDGTEEDGTDHMITPDDVRINKMVLNPAGGSFKTETQTVEIKLSDASESGWYQVEGGQKVAISKGETATVTIGADMDFKDTKTITWGSYNAAGNEATGSATYKKVDPNATITIYVASTTGSSPKVYAWTDDNGTTVKLNGEWPGSTLSQSVEVDGKTYYMLNCADAETVNVIFSDGSNKTKDIKGITSDAFFTYEGGDKYTQDDVNLNTPAVSLNPNGGTFKTDKMDVTVRLNTYAVSGWYQIGDGEQVSLKAGESKTFSIGEDMNFGDKKTVKWSATNDKGETRTSSATYTKVDPNAGITVYVKASSAPYLYAWDNNENALNGAWPGSKLTESTTVDGVEYWTYTVTDVSSFNIIFNNGSGVKTEDIKGITGDTYFTYDGGNGYTKVGSDDPVPPTPVDGKFYAYFLAPANWSKVMAWVWIDGGSNYTGGSWPGVDCVKTGEQKNGKDVWKWTYSGTETATPGKIIFNNGNSGDGNQTGNMPFVNGACYDMNGKTDIVISGINSIAANAKAGKAIVYTISGAKVAEVGSMEDAEYILAPGVYVCNGKKYVIK